jgi:predicted nucleic acid-binding protein
VILLDAYALIAFLVGGPAAARVRAILREGDAAVATANLAEALDVAGRIYGLAIERSVEVLDPLLEGPLTPVALDVPVAQRAADIRAEHYHRSTRPISLADAVLLASAGTVDRIATADPDVLAVAKSMQIAVIELPEQS